MKHFLDIGANVGQTFDYLETLLRDFHAYHFWAFEPSPRHFSKLLAQVEKYRDKYDITVCPFGIGGISGVRRFYEKDDAMGDSFQRVHASDHHVKNVFNGYDVESYVMGIRDFISAYTEKGDEIVIDMDSEGAEYETMRALLSDNRALARVTDIWVEWHHVPGSGVTIEDFNRVCVKNGISYVHRGIHSGHS